MTLLSHPPTTFPHSFCRGRRAHHCGSLRIRPKLGKTCRLRPRAIESGQWPIISGVYPAKLPEYKSISGISIEYYRYIYNIYIYHTWYVIYVGNLICIHPRRRSPVRCTTKLKGAHYLLKKGISYWWKLAQTIGRNAPSSGKFHRIIISISPANV